ncbi:hypothetical protein [Wolbachia endosymbiont of Chironomus riparius]|uniref:hypothetical protein n=1 Tax=Wolbachia endosymbiont of Chironomus riparius TaxID=2883238 RepID=UPI0020A0AB35|nr:hypothetical protein [Wolbachia endosymbiont of Chironomus riparius]
MIFVFLPNYGNTSSVDSEWKDVEGSVRNFFSSLSSSIDKMSPSTIIGGAVALILTALIFRGLIIFIIILGVLFMMFGNTEKLIVYVKEKLDLQKSIYLKSNLFNKEKNDKNDKNDKNHPEN